MRFVGLCYFLPLGLGRGWHEGTLAATNVDGMVRSGATCERYGHVGSPDLALVFANFALGHALNRKLVASPRVLGVGVESLTIFNVACFWHKGRG